MFVHNCIILVLIKSNYLKDIEQTNNVLLEDK